jgi:hypothetical protein
MHTSFFIFLFILVNITTVIQILFRQVTVFLAPISPVLYLFVVEVGHSGGSLFILITFL